MQNNPSISQITKELLASYNLYPKKRLGQHFLIDPQVLQRIITAAELKKDDLVLEIGPGLGVLTAKVAKLVGKLVAVDVDQDMIDICKQVLKGCDNVELVKADILKHKIAHHFTKVIGNLPYNITSPIIEKIFKMERKPEIAVVMTQKEVAKRMAARPGSKQYGSFSVFVQFYAEVELDSLVSKSSFLPWPEVSSAIVVLKPYQTPKYQVKSEKRFFDIVHTAFQQRRKMIRSTLKKYDLQAAGVNPNLRPEMLSVEDFVKIENI